MYRIRVTVTGSRLLSCGYQFAVTGLRLLVYGYQFSIIVLRLPDFSYTLRLRVAVTCRGYELRLRVYGYSVTVVTGVLVVCLRLVCLGVVVGDGIGDNIWVK